MPRLSLARRLNFQQIRREIGDSFLGIGLGLAPAFAAEDTQRRLGLAGADVFANEVRLRHRHEQPGRFLFRIACTELDHEAFLSALGFLAAGARRARLHRQDLQPKITPDAVLQMHDVITHAQVGKIDLERGARGGGVGRLEPTRPLRTGAAKNLRVGDDDQLGRLNEEPPRNLAKHSYRLRFVIALGQAVLGPQFVEPLQLALCAAHRPHRVPTSKPAVELAKKLATLRLGDLRIIGRLAKRPVCVEALYRQKAVVARLSHLLLRHGKRRCPRPTTLPAVQVCGEDGDCERAHNESRRVESTRDRKADTCGDARTDDGAKYLSEGKCCRQQSPQHLGTRMIGVALATSRPHHRLEHWRHR